MSPVVAEPGFCEVDELCRLVLVARRLGCHVHLTGVDDGLRELLELAGVDDLVLGDDAKGTDLR